jgi:hypothetical protein
MSRATWADEMLFGYQSKEYDKTDYTISRILKAEFHIEEITRLLNNMKNTHKEFPSDRRVLNDYRNDISEDIREIEKLLLEATDF